MKKNVVKNIFILILLLGIAGLLSIPILKDIKFGLDLKGGFEVLYQVETIDGSNLTTDIVNNTSKTLMKRIDVLGVTEPSITIEGNDKIRVQLAGVTNPDEARNVLGKAASLSFRDTNDNLLMTSSVLKAGGAKVSSDNYGNPAVSLSVSDNETFYKVTKALSESENNTMVIWLDFEEGTDSYSNTYSGSLCGSDSSHCLSAATVSQGFASDVIIRGENFTEADVKSLVELINSGSLPTKLTEISSKTVAASFGDSSLTKTCVAGVVGVALIVLLMIFMYRFAGFVASVGIILYAFVTLFAFWLVGGVLTLPGIAAMVIGIGMAIDSSVISFARIKDELAKGTKLQMAYKNGNKNSFMAIFDSNLTTLVVAFVLFILGESSVKGFATMLIISTIVTMCIMVFLTRVLLGMFVKTGYFDNKLNFFVGYKEKKNKFSFDFVKHSKKFFMITVLIVIAGIFSLTRLGLKLGIDFKGGTSITIKAENVLNEEELNKDIEKMEFDLEEIEFINEKDVIIKIDNSLSNEEVLSSEKYFSEKYNAQTEIGVVSNIVKKELVKNAFISVLVASICIILYISFRFKFSFAIAGIIALLHDVFLIIAFFSLLQLEVNSMFIAAILSIIGYSINDTIVTFDRIRENINEKKSNKILPKEELKKAVNDSLNQTIGRSIITTITTLMPVISLIVLGSHEIINFNIALLIGLIAGVYSSIFIASQIWFMIEKRSSGKVVKKKWFEE